MGRILSIDYGRRRIGLAISDEDELFAFSLEILSSEKTDKLFALLQNKINELNPSTLVIGYPLGYDMKPTQMSLEVDEFIKNLEDNGIKDIVRWNEVGTSKLAQLNFRQVNKRKAVDSEAARIILQEYLDFIKNK